MTGSAGFIGGAVSERLLARGDTVVGVDNLDPYYDVELKKARLARLSSSENFREARIDISDRVAVADVFARERRSLKAGNMASRNGSARLAPSPLRRVRRGSDFPVSIVIMWRLPSVCCLRLSLLPRTGA